MNTQTQLLIRTPEACRPLGIHRTTLRQLVRTGALREIRLTPFSHPRYRRDEVVALATGEGRAERPNDGGT